MTLLLRMPAESIPHSCEHYVYAAFALQTGTDGQWWLDWDREYRAWKAAGIPVSVTYQFLAKEQPPSSWPDAYGTSYQLGFKFARHFGKTAGTGTVESFEVGNEPWDYNATFYSTVSAGGVKVAMLQIHVNMCMRHALAEEGVEAAIASQSTRRLLPMLCHPYSS